jgi:hypothetical protein
MLLVALLLVAGELSPFFLRKKSPPPAWVNTLVSDPEYFMGVGSARIDKKKQTHIENARKDALNELASGISVEIFSSNVLVTLVKNDKLKDEFSSLIRARIITDLEGYEVVDTWQDKKNYWVLYRLSKDTYYQQQERKKQDATAIALSFYNQALKAQREGDYKIAIIMYSRTIDAVKLYLHEPIIALTPDGETNIVVQSFARVTSLIQSLQVTSPAKTLELLFSTTPDLELLRFNLATFNGKPVAGFPVLAHYSETAIAEPIRVTDADGRVQFKLPLIKSLKTNEMLTLTPDISRVIQESATNFTVRKAILDIPVQTLNIPVIIRRPSICFEVDERITGKGLSESMLGKIFGSLTRVAGFSIADKSEADFIAFIEADTKILSRVNGVYTTELQGDIVLTDRNDNIRYSARFAPVKGMQLTPELASLDAYRTLLKQVENRWFREMLEAMTR